MLDVKNLSVGYAKQEVLTKLSVGFERGKVCGVIGVNGCGKSTLLKAILGILPISEGEIFVDGKSLQDMSRNEIARTIAYLPQGKATPNMTVEQMVLHGRFPYLHYPRRYSPSDREMAYHAMEQMGIAQLAHRLMPTLSGGMRQNAYIAMALAQDTQYILLDEPTAYLDIAHQIQLMDRLTELAKQGKGIVTVTHDLLLAANYCHQLALLHEGRIATVGTGSQICRQGILETVFGVGMGIHSADGQYYLKLRK